MSEAPLSGRKKTATAYAGQARLHGGPDGDYPMVPRPWAGKGTGVDYTLEDSIVKRTETDLWKQGGKIEKEIKKTHMEAYAKYLLVKVLRKSEKIVDTCKVLY